MILSEVREYMIAIKRGEKKHDHLVLVIHADFIDALVVRLIGLVAEKRYLFYTVNTGVSCDYEQFYRTNNREIIHLTIVNHSNSKINFAFCPKTGYAFGIFPT